MSLLENGRNDKPHVWYTSRSVRKELNFELMKREFASLWQEQYEVVNGYMNSACREAVHDRNSTAACEILDN